MIDHDEADLCLAILMGATTYGWDDAAVPTYRQILMSYDDASVLAQACTEVAANYPGKEKPPPGLIKSTYDSVLRRREATDRPALPQADGAIRPREGLKIAAEAYRQAYRREPPGDIFGLPDPESLPEATQRDIELAEATIACGNEYDLGWMSSYKAVLDVFRTDHRRARAALRALEQDRRIIWRQNGVLVLLRSCLEAPEGAETNA